MGGPGQEGGGRRVPPGLAPRAAGCHEARLVPGRTRPPDEVGRVPGAYGRLLPGKGRPPEAANEILPGRLASMAWAPRPVPCLVIAGCTGCTAGDDTAFHTDNQQTGNTAGSHQHEQHLKNAHEQTRPRGGLQGERSESRFKSK